MPREVKFTTCVTFFSTVAQSLNSKNDYDIFLNDEAEEPRLSVLKNFKSINRVMRSGFLKQAQDIPESEQPLFT